MFDSFDWKRLVLTGILLLSVHAVWAQIEHGKASYYSDKWKGRRTSSGERYHPDSLTAAHRTHPFGTYLRVTNEANGKSVVVKVTDRGPFVKGRVVDLSGKAARSIGMIQAGIAVVEVEVVSGQHGGPAFTQVDLASLPEMHARTVRICDEMGNCGARNPVWEFRALTKEERGKKSRKWWQKP